MVVLAVAPTLARALTLELSDPSYGLYHGITESEIGEETAIFAVDESRGNETGDLSLTSDIGHATAYSESDSFHLAASSSVDGSSLASLGLDSVSSEAAAYFEADFAVSGDAPLAVVELAYALSSSFVSTEPRAGFGEPGTSASHGLRQIRILDGTELVLGALMEQGSHTVSAEVETGKSYHLILRLNAVSSVGDSTGSASTDGLFSGEMSVGAVPEPGTAALLGGALVALAALRSPRVR